MGRIVVAGAFDTKAEPLGLLIKALKELDATPITIDTGVFGGDHGCDYPAAIVAEAAGHSPQDLPALGRAAAVSAMSEGAAIILAQLVDGGDVGALVCMGGSNAVTIFSHLTPVVPIGIPKILMATVVAGDTRPLVSAGDVIMLYPIVDIEGDNHVLRAMISRLARVAATATGFGSPFTPHATESVALSMFGLTNKCVTACRSLLASQGLESLVFHGNGTGGQSLESFVADGLVSWVIDATISEIADELLGGLWSAGPERLRTAAELGVPQVIAPGAIDMINFGTPDTVPETFSAHVTHQHNDLVTLVRTTPDENQLLGAVVAERLGEPNGPAAVLIPMRGFSELDIEGGPFHDPKAAEAFTAGLRAHVSAEINVIELDLHINDPKFAGALVAELLQGP